MGLKTSLQLCCMHSVRQSGGGRIGIHAFDSSGPNRYAYYSDDSYHMVIWCSTSEYLCCK